jgi:hypothetical protein
MKFIFGGVGERLASVVSKIPTYSRILSGVRIGGAWQLSYMRERAQ